MKSMQVLKEKGIPGAELRNLLQGKKSDDARWDQGKTFGFVYYPGAEHAAISEEYLNAFLYESTLNPAAFPSLKRFEKEIVQMAAGMMHGDKKACGSVTTGGTESIFLALKAARDKAHEKRGGDSIHEVVLPGTAHPAFLKACHLLHLKAVVVPPGKDRRADPGSMEKAVTPRTIMIAASAPCFPYGVVDPVEEIGEIARKHHLLFHVDACLGGFMLPFLEELGYAIPAFDFRVPGVTSISMDAHKYGYAPKGVSVILYRDRALRRKQFFVHTEWPGGIFASTTFMGTKSGGPLAGCWAVMKQLGREGYRSIAREVMDTTRTIRSGISRMEGLEVLGDPHMSVLAFTSDRGDIYNIGDALAEKGWYVDRLQFPEALHLTVTRLNTGREQEFLEDLERILSDQALLSRNLGTTRRSVGWVKRLTGTLPAGITDLLTRSAGSSMGRSGRGRGGTQAALYGISATFRDRRQVRRMVLNLLDGLY